MTAPASPSWPRPASAWWVVALLFLAGIFSVIDRAILNMVVDPVRHDLGIGDSGISLLQGLAFGLFYACMGLPMGLAADRISRRNLLMAGIGLWSLATIGSGLAAGFGQLFAARLLVGLGEAALGPCAISLISDLFPPDRRGRPISIYMMGQALAQGIAIIFTSRILAAAAAGTFTGWPVIADLAPWRIAFLLSGTLGLLVIAGLLTTREPKRQQASQLDDRSDFRECIAWFRGNRQVLAPLYIGFALCFLAAYGGAAWQPTMLMRGLGATPAFVGAWLGPLSMLFSALGPLIGGWLVDRSMRTGQPMLRFSLLAAMPLAALPSTLAVAAGDPRLAALIVATGNAVFAVIGTLMFATLQSIVPARMRGTSIALTLVLNTLVGAACGPLLVATTTSHVLGEPAQVGWAIALVCAPALIAGAGLYAIARRKMLQTGLTQA